MRVNRSNALVGTRFQELRGDNFLDGEDNAILAANADRCASILNSLDSVLDLEVAAIGGEDGVEQVVTCADGRLEQHHGSAIHSQGGMAMANRNAYHDVCGLPRLCLCFEDDRRRGAGS